MFYLFPFVADFGHRLDTDLQMDVREFFGYRAVGFLGLDAVGGHRRVRYQKQGTVSYLVDMADDEYRGGFHIYPDDGDFPQIVLEILVPLPYPAVCRVDNTGAVFIAVLDNLVRDEFVQFERRQRWNLGQYIENV